MASPCLRLTATSKLSRFPLANKTAVLFPFSFVSCNNVCLLSWVDATLCRVCHVEIMITHDDVSDGLLFNPYSVKMNHLGTACVLFFRNIRILNSFLQIFIAVPWNLWKPTKVREKKFRHFHDTNRKRNTLTLKFHSSFAISFGDLVIN